MPDPRFFLSKGPIAIAGALRISGATAPAGADIAGSLSRVASLNETDIADACVYIDDAGKTGALAGRRFGLCFAPPSAADASSLKSGGLVAIAEEPRAAFAAIAGALHAVRSLDAGGGEAPRIDQNARIHSTAIIGPGAEIGAGADIGPFVVIGPGVVIGARASIAEGVSIWCAIMGSDVRIGAGSAIGGPGFGFAAGAAGLARVPQLGRVIFGDRVEIGANSCVDRGALDDTTIGEGTKIDNLVQIGHNVRIGRNCVIAAQVGFAGSVVVGDRAQFGGQAGIADHLAIGQDARIAAKAGVMSDVPAGETWGGYPARPRIRWLREAAAAARAARPKKKATDNDD